MVIVTIMILILIIIYFLNSTLFTYSSVPPRYRSVGYQAYFPLWLDEYHISITLSSISLSFNISILSGVIITLCTIGLLMGAEESSRFNVCVTIANLVLIGFIVITGGSYVDPKNWTPLLPFGVKGK